MKKLFLGMLALSLMSSTAVYAGIGKKKKKAKTAKQCCKVQKNCDKTATCPDMPGCCK